MTCPRCGRLAVRSWGELYCFTCGTVEFTYEPRDAVYVPPGQRSLSHPYRRRPSTVKQG